MYFTMVYNKSGGLQVNNKQYLTTMQAARLLQVHWQTIHNYIKSGKLEAFKVGNGYRIPTASIESLIESRKTRI